MVTKAKPNFGQKPRVIKYKSISFSSEFVEAITAIFSLSDEKLESFISGLYIVLDDYSAVVAIEEAYPIDTKSQLKQAAIDIKKLGKPLLDRLEQNAGGMKPFLDNPVNKVLRDRAYKIHLHEFTQLLEAVVEGCDHYIDDIYPKSGKKMSNNKWLTRLLADYYRQFFGRDPKTTLSLEYEDTMSDFAALLKTCFKEVGIMISDGTIKSLMSWEKTNKKSMVAKKGQNCP